ncbi:pyridoxal-phosphate dependent enzyme [Candidatus Pelagibacter sp.]|nr:pyridoxal-phosphate dependent enzyme [Candidatus Pelagibacter sp.]
MRIKLTNNKKFKRDKKFYQIAIRTLKKIKKKLVPLKLIVKKNNNTKIVIADDTKQRQGSYKFRGASSEILNIKKKNIKTICLGSTGNFGLSMSYLCKKNKIDCNIFISKDTNIYKINNLKKNNSILHLNNKNYDDAKINAKRFAVKNRYKFQDVCTKSIFHGNASLILEIIKKLKEKDKNLLKKKILAIFPLGSGSLATPSIKILKYLNPKIKIAVVEPERFSKFFYIFDKKKKPSFLPTIAEGAGVKKIPEINYRFLLDNVDIVSNVSENEIKNAVKYLYRKYKIKAEGAGALSMSLFLKLNKKFSNFDYIIMPVCGTNIDEESFLKIIS